MGTDKNLSFGAYQPIVKAGDYYFVSGQVGVDATTKQAPADIAGQVNQAMINLGNVLGSVELTYHNVVKTTLYLANVEDFKETNDIYGSYFNYTKPARSTVGVKDLPNVGGDNKILFEIEAIAYKGGQQNENAN